MASSSGSRESTPLTGGATARICSATEDGYCCPYISLGNNDLCRKHHLLRQYKLQGLFIVEDLPLHLQEHINDGEEEEEAHDDHYTYPEDGEVWLVVKDWQHGDKRMRCHDVVEILDGYITGLGVCAAKLTPAKGSGSGGGELFERETLRGFVLTKDYSEAEMWRFLRRLSAEKVYEDLTAPPGYGGDEKKVAWSVAWE